MTSARAVRYYHLQTVANYRAGRMVNLHNEPMSAKRYPGDLPCPLCALIAWQMARGQQIIIDEVDYENMPSMQTSHERTQPARLLPR